jgi:8-oxo-dGTP pyrophosphatase MutT (NUDIX family)
MSLLNLIEDLLPQKQNVCGLIECGDKFLVVSRIGKHTEFGLPGGRREFGEKERDALKREILEETEAVVRVEDCIFRGKTTATYYCTLLTAPVLGINKENGLVKWGTREELESGPFGLYNKLLFKKVLL